MKTQAAVSSLCFIEIKRHDQSLVALSQYRPNVWPPSKELTSGVAQIQTTVQSAIEELQSETRTMDEDGNPTDEVLYNIRPRCILLIGNLSEFSTDHGINRTKFSSFELYRRNLVQPEVITYDELFHRARFIVEHTAQTSRQFPE